MTCYTQSYCLHAALRPRLALYLTSYQTKFLITSRNVPQINATGKSRSFS